MRRLGAVVALLMTVGGCAEPRWYVDRIEGGQAVLIASDGSARVVSTQALPPDAGEGSWISRTQRDPALEQETRKRIAAQRQALAADDDGARLVLGR